MNLCASQWGKKSEQLNAIIDVERRIVGNWTYIEAIENHYSEKTVATVNIYKTILNINTSVFN